MPDPIPGQYRDDEEPKKKGFDPKAYFEGQGEQFLTPKKMLYKHVHELFSRLISDDKQPVKNRDILSDAYTVPYYEEQKFPVELPSIGCDEVELIHCELDQFDPDYNTLRGMIRHIPEDARYIRMGVKFFKAGKPHICIGDEDVNPDQEDDYNERYIYQILLAPEMDPVVIQERGWDRQNLSLDDKLKSYPRHMLEDDECLRVLSILEQASVLDEKS